MPASIDPTSLTGAERRAIREKAAVSQDRLAYHLGVTSKTVRTWEAGGRIGIAWQALRYRDALEKMASGVQLPYPGGQFR